MAGLNKKLVDDNRKICLILDSFSGHKINNLSNVKFVFLFPNSTNVLQPQDIGIIKSFKGKYFTILKTDILTRGKMLQINYQETLKNKLI